MSILNTITRRWSAKSTRLPAVLTSSFRFQNSAVPESLSLRRASINTDAANQVESQSKQAEFQVKEVFGSPVRVHKDGATTGILAPIFTTEKLSHRLFDSSAKERWFDEWKTEFKDNPLVLGFYMPVAFLVDGPKNSGVVVASMKINKENKQVALEGLGVRLENEGKNNLLGLAIKSQEKLLPSSLANSE